MREVEPSFPERISMRQRIPGVYAPRHACLGINEEEGCPSSLAAESPRWSRDGRWIYFNTFLPNGYTSGGIYKVPAMGGSPELGARTSGFNAQEDRTGRKLYFMADQTDAPLHVLDLATGEERALDGMPTVHFPTDWIVGTHAIYFIDSAVKPATINVYDFASHRVTRRMPLPKAPQLWGGLALSPDESWLAYAQVDRNDSDLMLAEPFR